MAWSNRIVREAEVDPRELAAHSLNPHDHPEAQRERLAKVLSTIGAVDTIIVSEATKRVLNGHARLELALETGQAQVDVTYVDVTEEEESWILATFDAIGRMAGTDPSKVAEAAAKAGKDAALAEIAAWRARAEQALESFYDENEGVRAGAEGEAADPRDDGDGEPIATYLRFGGYAIPLSDERARALDRIVDGYAEERSVTLGFVNWIRQRFE